MNNSVAAYLWLTPFHVDTLQLELRYFSGWHQSYNFANNNYVAEFCLFQEVVNSLPARLRLVLRFPCANIAALARLYESGGRMHFAYVVSDATKNGYWDGCL